MPVAACAMKVVSLGVTALSQAQAQSQSHSRHFSLNSDGKRHPYLNAAATLIVVAGIIAFVAGLFGSMHLLATVLGMIGLVVGLWAQMMSATREERIFIVLGVVGAFVGMGLGLAHGGFS